MPRSKSGATDSCRPATAQAKARSVLVSTKRKLISRRRMRISEGKKRSHQRVRLALTERDTEITKATYRFQLLFRDQYIEAGFFGSVTAANTRLPSLVEAP